MPLNVQHQLLRALDGHEVRSVGGDVKFSINARIIAATNSDPGRIAEVRQVV